MKKERERKIKHGFRRNIGRREFAKAAGLGAAGLIVESGLTSRASAGERPNILMIMVDQMRAPRWFPKDAQFPAFERLGREGLSFVNNFTSAVPCSPSRASLFTGLHLPQHGVNMNVSVNLLPGCGSMDPGITTLGHVFKKAGYRTPYFGKWHLSLEDDYKDVGLSRYGFDNWRGPDRYGTPLEGLMYDSRFADQTVRWLERNGQNGPWFLTCSLINPHDIMFYSRIDVPPLFVPDVCDKLPENFEDSLEGKPRAQAQWQRAWGELWGMTPERPLRAWREYIDFYYYLTQKVDAQIAKVLETLDRTGLADNTIVIFISDHGEMAGSHKLQGKGPFVYHENNHVPLIFRLPGRIQSGAKTRALAQSVDIFPTLLGLAGITAAADHLPGKSLLPVIQDPAQTGPNDHVLMAWGYSSAADLGPISKYFNLPKVTAPMQVRAIYDGRHKYARYFDKGTDEQEYELYDLINDPLELRNIAADPAYRAIKKEMADRLLEAEVKEMKPL